MSIATYTYKWRGPDYRQRGDEAARRALMDIAVEAALDMKFLVTVVTGTTQRSVHVAPRGYDGGGQIKDPGSDASRARGGEDLLVSSQGQMGDMAPTQGLQVGSWVPWAERQDAERSPFVTPAGEEAAGKWEEYCRKRFREGGLSDR